MRVPFLDLQAQYVTIKTEMDQAISATVSSAAFIGGAQLGNFERSFADYLGIEHCVGVGNGTDALEIAMRALDLPDGGEVIVPANSFVGSSEAVTNVGLRVRFADVDQTYTLDLTEVAAAINDSTVAIMPVHLYGCPADMSGILSLAAEHGLRVIEDCAQAHGAEYHGQRVGTIGDIGAFSFYPGKNLGAYGDAGAVVTRDEALAARVRMLANHGRIAKYDHIMEGRNSRLDALQAAVLQVKLKHLPAWTARRREVARQYVEGLSGTPWITLPLELESRNPVHHIFPVRTTRRDDLRRYLVDREIATGIHYPFALPELEAYRYLKQGSRAPRASKYARELLSLPMGEHLSDYQVEYVVSAIADFSLS